MLCYFITLLTNPQFKPFDKYGLASMLTQAVLCFLSAANTVCKNSIAITQGQSLKTTFNSGAVANFHIVNSFFCQYLQ